ncbi:MAG: hypothetical protein JWL58_5204 [Streptosporangiaceae bacterium]|nr:hypothetical protein [Streptosporangiaceae bacterium]
MTRRAAMTIALMAVMASACAACAGSPARPVQNPGHTVAVGQGYTSDQLRQALLTDLSGYRRAGEPDSGEYGSLKAIQNFNQLQGQVKLDKPQCGTASRAFGSSTEAQNAPAAITTFTKDDGQTVTETLLTISAATADRQVKLRVPAGCRTFRALVGDQWSTHQIVEATQTQLGGGSRTVGVATTSGSSHVKTWYVVLRSRGYLASITMYGVNVTQVDAEEAAREAYAQAERILP